MSDQFRYEYGQLGKITRWKATSLEAAELEARRSSEVTAMPWAVWDTAYVAPRALCFRGVRYAPDLKANV